MYKYCGDINAISNKTKAASIIGIARTSLSKIFNGNRFCSKVLAFSITKYIDKDAEIEDYFEKVEKGE